MEGFDVVLLMLPQTLLCNVDCCAKKAYHSGQTAKWKPNNTFTCSLCEKCPDSHDHLFFSCDFSKKNSIENIVRRLILEASVYMIWKERNTRLFQGKKQTEEVVIKQIEDSIKTSLMSLIVKDSVAVRKVKAVWFVKMVRKVTTVVASV
ncbi:hypothetical protein Tco_0992519 [Tanacetum coccineum]|uniref:Reverse transcriptase zinc-binding domain-containing protein n=1 Tax=Tanacetum coccineum TaxID=301880 RepID=A0ABQ5F3N3_9ASTR